VKNDSGSKFAFREVANVTTKPAKIPGSSPFHSDRDAIYEAAIMEKDQIAPVLPVRL